MPSIVVLGATGNLGQHVCRQALERGWALSVAVRGRARLGSDIAARAQVTEFDLSTITVEQLAAYVAGHDLLVFCAGVVTQGDAFVQLFDTVVSAVQANPAHLRPVSWFIAGAALLPFDKQGRLGVDLPKVKDTYWPHRKNYQRLQNSTIDWRLLCPGPMTNQPALGERQLRIAIDRLPAPLPSIASVLPAPLVLPLFAMAIPNMIVPYADAAALMLNHSAADDAFSRHRIGLALPLGMKGKKDQWAAQARADR